MGSESRHTPGPRCPFRNRNGADPVLLPGCQRSAAGVFKRGIKQPVQEGMTSVHSKSIRIHWRTREPRPGFK
jgi:hypothetical protein